MRVFRSLVVVATAMAVCSAPAAMAVEGSSGLETDAYSVVELSEGESISIPEGYAAGVVEEDSSSQMFRSATTAPSCVEAKMEKAAVQVYNNCDAPMRIKVVMTSITSPVLGSKDTSCEPVAPHSRKNVKWVVRGLDKIDRVELC